MLAVVLLLGIFLFAAVGGTRSVRASLKTAAARSLLAALDRAVEQYHRDAGAYPPAADDLSCEPALTALINHRPARELLARVPVSAWLHTVPPRILDPWGTPLRYLGPAQSPARIAANAGRPIFLSAGPDRSFGDVLPSALGDNLATDDPLESDHRAAAP